MKKRSKKLFIGAASATLLMASSSDLSQKILYIPQSLLPHKVEAASNSSIFLSEAKRLPNVSLIREMARGIYGIMNFDETKTDIIHTRNLYNRLSTREKNQAEVKKWEGYLVAKETAVGITFVNDVRALSSVAHLRQLSGSQLTTQIRQINVARSSYNQLSQVAKGDQDVMRWEGFLMAKENVVKNTSSNFLNLAKRLPSVSAIQTMNAQAFQNAKVNTRQVRNTYNSLRADVKNNSEIILWESYLVAKENALGLGFIDEVRALPNVSAIENMDATQRMALDTEFKNVWNTYNSLAQPARNDSDVLRWVGYFNQKEAALVLSEPHIKERIGQINQKWAELKPTNGQVEYVKSPSAQAPYALGQLSATTLNEALKVTNFIRSVSHLPADVQLNESFNEEAQAAAVVNAANWNLSHSPAQPAGMDEAMYHLGYEGASTSNIGMGYSSVIRSIVSGYMEDGDYSNIDRVGHRLWILSPRLKEVGFGYANGLTSMKVISDSMWNHTPEPYDFVSWPAETAMPLHSQGTGLTFWDSRFPWSISLNDDVYDNQQTSNVHVELTRLNDNQSWHFSSSTADGYFNISTSSYGYLPYTIIFRPETLSYKPGDLYRVTITGIKGADGLDKSVQFETTFFNLAY